MIKHRFPGRLSPRLLALLVVLVLAALTGTYATARPASAYSIGPCPYGWHTMANGGQFWWNDQATQPAYDAFNYGASSWTSTPTKVWLVGPGTGAAGIYTNNYNYGNNGYDGITYYTGCSGGWFYDSNTSYLNSYYTYWYSYYERISVATHELGHAIGLGHSNPPLCNGVPVMYYSTDRYVQCGIYTPQQDDVNGLNHLYP